MSRLATAYTVQTQAAHEPFHGAACHDDALAVHLLPNPVGTVYLKVSLQDTFNLRHQSLMALCSGTTQFRVVLPGRKAPVSRQGNLQHFADWLDPVGIPALVDAGVHDFSLRSSSA